MNLLIRNDINNKNKMIELFIHETFCLAFITIFLICFVGRHFSNDKFNVKSTKNITNNEKNLNIVEKKINWKN